jgi:hypothetical protein
MSSLEEQAQGLQAIAEELEAAASHCRVAATHLVEGEIPRSAAHSWAAFGHAQHAVDRLTDQSKQFADRSVPVISDES